MRSSSCCCGCCHTGNNNGFSVIEDRPSTSFPPIGSDNAAVNQQRTQQTQTESGLGACGAEAEGWRVTPFAWMEDFENGRQARTLVAGIPARKG